MKSFVDIASAAALGFVFLTIMYGDQASVLLRPFMPSESLLKLQPVTRTQSRWAKSTGSKVKRQKITSGNMQKSLSWMQLGRIAPGFIRKKKDCERLKVDLRLPLSQVRNCKRYHSLMTGVEIAANLSMMACVGVTKQQRWNCSSLLGAPEVGAELRKPTREQAFVHALSSAALVWVISKYCASGRAQNCSCAPQVAPVSSDTNLLDNGKQYRELSRRQRNVDHHFHRSGCNEDISFASHFAQRWTDMIPPRSRVRRLARNDEDILKMHNNAVGREVTASLYKHNCKCHGMSASCATQTCWYSLPKSFKPLAHRIKDMWVKDAQYLPQVYQLPSEAALRRGQQPRLNNFRKLVFNEASPDYCKYDTTRGTPGTQGRECHVNHMNRNESYCGNLCCGRGWNEIVQQTVEPWNCKMACCWKVVCSEERLRTVSKFYCK